jgi:hypothetical protein
VTEEPRLRVTLRQHRGAVVVEPVGVLDVLTYAELRDTLLKAAVEAPSAVIVDIEHLSMPSTHLLTVFSVVWMRVCEWPGVPLLLVATDSVRRAQLISSPVSGYVPVHPDLTAAMRTTSRPPVRRRCCMSLPATAASSGVAREFVRQLCCRWGIVSMIEDASAVATELIENVVQHTESPAELRLELRKGILSVAVSDRDPRPAILREAASELMPSAGLAIVARVARVWGCTPTATGKIVWAVLRVGPDLRSVASVS